MYELFSMSLSLKLMFLCLLLYIKYIRIYYVRGNMIDFGKLCYALYKNKQDSYLDYMVSFCTDLDCFLVFGPYGRLYC